MKIGCILLICLSIYLFFRMEKLRERKKQLQKAENKIKELEKELVALQVERAELKTSMHEQKKLSDERLSLVREEQEKLTQAFKALSAEALDKTSQSFLHLAHETLGRFHEKAKSDLDKKQQVFEAVVKPVRESLRNLDEGMRLFEKERKGEQGALKEQLETMLKTEKELKLETSTLVKALRMPTVRGRWGEIQLKRVVELAGMVNHCDFFEQQTDAKSHFRPDLIIRLPGEKQVVIDAKTPCDAYLEAVQSDDIEYKIQKLKAHARALRNHVSILGKKSYWENFIPTPEFVVLFIPSDNFFNSALEYDPTLIEVGIEQGVVIATPTTLIGLLRAIAYGWKQDTLSQHAKKVSNLGHELYKRIVDMSGHWTKVGRGLVQAVEAYNRAVGSLEMRVLVSARKFKELGAAGENIELEELSPLECVPRKLASNEMQSNVSLEEKG